jgi:methionyl-tRNA synthetase
MSGEKKRFTITAALPYANGPLHLGHLAGAYLPADIFARYQRLRGNDVAFICGSDEHGAAITLRAKKEGITPQEIIDKYHGMIRDSFEKLNVSFDIYHRTSSALHHQTAQDFFRVLLAKDAFTTQKSLQFYDEAHSQFLADRYITGECPKCHHPHAYGDQCEKCGASLSPQELINPKSVLSGETPLLRETEHWYLPLDRHEGWLREYIGKGVLNGEQHHNPQDWKNHVVGQCMSWIDGGLKPRAMTRDLDWGVPVPVGGANGKVLYVWLDAPIGYISATRQWAADNGKNWEDYWRSADSQLIHFIGKDNIVFHCIIFPIILKEYGGYNLPVNVPANEFLNLEGDKFSTSRNWAVWLHEYLGQMPGREDELRYVLGSILPETKDAEFTWKDYQARVNNELVAILGNFVNRAVVLTHKYFDGKVPAANAASSADQEVLDGIYQQAEKIAQAIDCYRFREALAELMNLARIGNKYLADTEPWKLAKTDMDRTAAILNTALQVCSALSVLCEPFMPFTSAKLRGQLNIEKAAWNEHLHSILSAGHTIAPATLLFAKVEDETIERQIALLNANKAQTPESTSTHKPMKPEINFDDFTKLDIRTATILEAERVEGADKLLKLKVDTGLDIRTVVSGIAQHYKPEEVVGKTVSLLMNLAPRKIRGVESQGMILMAEDAEGNLAFVSPEKPVGTGSEVR